jgi:hypothetical protein
MNDKNIFSKIQNDLNSKPIVFTNNDDYSNIKKTLGSKYIEDMSDSDNETSYKNRNLDIINKLSSKKNKPEKKNKSKKGTNKEDKEDKEDKDNLEDTNEKDSSLPIPKKKETKKDIKKDNLSSDIPEEENNSEYSEDEEGEYEFTEEFANKVKLYVKNDDRIRELQMELKTLTNAKKAAEIDILKHLERLGESCINVTGGKLRINQYESKNSLKEDIIKEAISEEGIKDPKIIERIFEKINEKRQTGGKIQKSLKRTFERNKKK